MQLEDRAAFGSGGRDVEDVRLDNGEVWRKPPKALWMLDAAMATVNSRRRREDFLMTDGRLPRGAGERTTTSPRYDYPVAHGGEQNDDNNTMEQAAADGASIAGEYQEPDVE